MSARLLVACERGGAVREAFALRGVDAWSCDLEPSDVPGQHIQGDAIEALRLGWDMVIAHPPCTFFATTGARWFYHPEDSALPRDERRPHPLYPNRKADREQARRFFMSFVGCAPLWAIENPRGYMERAYRRPDQVIQPHHFGHDASKATCLWLGGLPPLMSSLLSPVSHRTTSTGKRFSTWYWNTSRGKGAERQRERSKTFQGIADAMADQWGGLLLASRGLAT